MAAYYRPGDYLLFTAGAVGYAGTDGRINPAGTMASAGNNLRSSTSGYRDHWLSPLSDSSMLMSTEAPTLPSVTLSNLRPLGALGLEYELFLARMSYTNQILWHDALTAGYPRLAGMHLGIQPVDGWAISGNGTWQFGGGARPGGIGQFFSSLFSRTQLPTSTGGDQYRQPVCQSPGVDHQRLHVSRAAAVRGLRRVRGARHAARQSLSLPRCGAVGRGAFPAILQALRSDARGFGVAGLLVYRLRLAGRHDGERLRHRRLGRRLAHPRRRRRRADADGAAWLGAAFRR